MFIFVLTFFQGKTKIMDKKVKLALLALLGFSTACSTVRSGSKSREREPAEVERPTTIVMYGVRPPGQAGPATGVHIPAAKVQSAAPEALAPVAEKPTEDTPVMDTKKGAKAPEK